MICNNEIDLQKYETQRKMFLERKCIKRLDVLFWWKRSFVSLESIYLITTGLWKTIHSQKDLHWA